MNGVISVFLEICIYIFLINLVMKIQTLKLIKALEIAISYRSKETEDHMKRISCYSTLLAKELKMSPIEINQIKIYASLHDIGKIGISDSILKKPEKLNFHEFEEMKKHTIIGYEIIANITNREVPVNIIKFHHENWDGSGYPEGLRGKEIPLEARIISIVDVYDALRQKRIYKDSIEHEEAIKIICSLSGKKFDPDIVKLFFKLEKKFKEIFEKNN